MAENEFDRVINGDFSMWKEAVAEWMKQLEGDKKCAICSFPLHNENFPEDFPDEFKFCCGCLGIAKLIIKGTLMENDLTGNFYDRVLNKITLVK